MPRTDSDPLPRGAVLVGCSRSRGHGVRPRCTALRPHAYSGHAWRRLPREQARTFAYACSFTAVKRSVAPGYAMAVLPL